MPTPEPMHSAVSLRFAVAVAFVALVALLFVAPPAQAQGRVTVSTSNGLNPAGQTVTVAGRGFDPAQGVYVAFCVDNGPGVKASPCMGGADTTGASKGSIWVSSNPPAYGEGLAVPYGPGGTFSARLRLAAVDQTMGTDCRITRCAIVVRFDHTRPEDRSGDIRVPITFSAKVSAPTTTSRKPSSKPSVRTAPSSTRASVATTAPSSTMTGTTATATAATTSETSGTTSAAAADVATEPASADTPLARPILIGAVIVLALAGTALWQRLRRRRPS